MSKLIYTLAFALGSATWFPAYLAAQNPSADSPSTDAAAIQDDRADASAEPGAGAQYVPSLNGGGLIAMDPGKQSLLLFGASFSGGWDSNADESQGAGSSGVFTLSPYLGFQANSGSTQYVIQYQPTIARYTSSDLSSGTLHQATAKLIGVLNPRWHWEGEATATHGQDSNRFLAPIDTQAVGEVPAASLNAAAYRPNAGTVTMVEAGGVMTYLKSERDSFQFHVDDSYSHFSGIGGNNSVASTRLDYVRRLSPTVGLTTYGQWFLNYGTVQCSSFGTGIDLSWQIRERTSLAAGGGPQINSAACGSRFGYSYDGAFSTRLSGVAQLYLLGSRQFSTGYLGPGLWQDSLAAGYQRQVLSSGVLSFDAGYSRSTGLAQGGDYSGTFFGGTYGRRIRRGLGSSFSYRRFMGSTGGTSFNRDFLMFSLNWNSNTVPLFK